MYSSFFVVFFSLAAATQPMRLTFLNVCTCVFHSLPSLTNANHTRAPVLHARIDFVCRTRDLCMNDDSPNEKL